MHKRVKIRIIMFRLLAVLAMLSAWVNGAHSSPNDSIKVLPDSSNFVTASLVIISPTDDGMSFTQSGLLFFVRDRHRKF